MRTIALVAAAALALSACEPGPATTLEDAVRRAEIIRICADGTYVGRDPQTGRYLTAKPGWATTRAWLAPGIRPADVCGR